MNDEPRTETLVDLVRKRELNGKKIHSTDEGREGGTLYAMFKGGGLRCEAAKLNLRSSTFLRRAVHQEGRFQTRLLNVKRPEKEHPCNLLSPMIFYDSVGRRRREAQQHVRAAHDPIRRTTQYEERGSFRTN